MFYIERKDDGHRLPPASDDDGTNVFLCWPTREEAERGKAYQHKLYLQDQEDEWDIVEITP